MFDFLKKKVKEKEKPEIYYCATKDDITADECVYLLRCLTDGKTCKKETLLSYPENIKRHFKRVPDENIIVCD